METKSLLYGLIGFFAGGLLVSVAATTFDKPAPDSTDMGMSMSQMTESLKDKQGDEFDQAYITGMIEHHEGAVEMAQLAEENAKHEEIKALSRDIITAQKKEIDEMKQWQVEWDYSTDMKGVHSEHH